ncbi:PIN2/TERF1-interacting telomerase inhibitor 1 [Hyla sarda]|uniref:PIN2/TERF1-interacting telomerase inhibitor 1 n=1 Tax=Hyla sarda TaxID=327740 RepID=UPI0024C27FCF|nr:PIN2/TERF1-interacting telomerase inhibitor 1 [Hyla sarda]
MAMLAEPRRKQKWSVDPRNSTWSKDENKFGQKMMEKMGWSKGKGLGAQEQGSTEHIKVQMKNNTLGLGAANNHEDNWIAHQDDFNQLLEELNSHHGAGSAASSDNENKKTFSLEEKSKSSKKRVHYMKFAKGKDLSCRSDTDLACIFGKREKVKKSSKEETDSDPEEENENKSPSPATEVEPGNTVTSSLSVNEYFAKRMAALKKSYAKCTESVSKSVEEGPEDSVDGYSEDTKKKSKKKKHRKNHEDHCPEELEVEKTLQDEDQVDTTDHQEKKRKSKSRKKDKILVENSVEEREEEDETLRKKKKKNKRRKELGDERQMEDVNSTPDEDVGTEQPKKKKKKRKHERPE